MYACKDVQYQILKNSGVLTSADERYSLFQDVGARESWFRILVGRGRAVFAQYMVNKRQEKTRLCEGTECFSRVS